MHDLRERLLRPREGWLSLVLLALMVLALTWSVQGAGWLEQLDFLGAVGLYAVLAGALLGLLPISTLVTLPLGALLGGGIVIWTVGGEYHPALTQQERFLALGTDLTSWLQVVLDGGYPAQMSPYALGLATVMWVTAATAAHALYRYHRALDAILLIGVAMVANMSATFADLFIHLLLFVAAALLLWLRSSLTARQDSWQRRRVNENLEVPASIMRSGVLFAAGCVALAWLMTSVAVAAPLTSVWRSLDTVWTGARDQFENVFGSITNPQSRLPGNSFGSGFAVTGAWYSNDDEVMVVASTRKLYMRTATYDLYTGRGWERSEVERRQVEPGQPLFPGEADSTPERPSVDVAFDIETITVEMRQAMDRNLFVPGYPLKIFAPVVLLETGGHPVLGGLEAANSIGSGEAYQVSAALSKVTEAELSTAGVEYPAVVTELYLDASRATERVRQEATRIVTEAGATTPYEQAKALARYLSRDSSFSYRTRAPVPPPGQDLVDFFLNEGERTGYCQYYASAMVLMARSLGIPARVAVGFAPGEAASDGTYLVREAQAHAWAEVYFPGYGWQIFEATKSIDSGFIRLPGISTPVQPPPGAVAGVDDPATNALLEFENRQDIVGTVSTFASPPPFVQGGWDARQGPPAPGGEAREGNATLLIGIALVILVLVGIRLRSSRRRWRFLPAGDRAWMRLSLAADRAGVAPRPAETVYEYAGWLEEQIPKRRPEIRTLADGKVWQDYSGRPMRSSGIARLEEAWRRLRVPFALLTLRHWLRSLFRRG